MSHSEQMNFGTPEVDAGDGNGSHRLRLAAARRRRAIKRATDADDLVAEAALALSAIFDIRSGRRLAMTCLGDSND